MSVKNEMEFSSKLSKVYAGRNSSIGVDAVCLKKIGLALIKVSDLWFT